MKSDRKIKEEGKAIRFMYLAIVWLGVFSVVVFGVYVALIIESVSVINIVFGKLELFLILLGSMMLPYCITIPFIKSGYKEAYQLEESYVKNQIEKRQYLKWKAKRK